MNRKTIQQAILLAFGTVDLHPLMPGELLKLVTKSGYELRLFQLLVVRLAFLGQFGVDATRHEEFELIGDGIFSMHLSGKGFNLRILYSFLPNGDPSLLLCFYERAGKSKTDYTPYLKPAIDRFKERMEAYEDEHRE